MPYGQLEVYVANARGLDDTNWLTDMNPYVVVTCRTEEKKSSTASGEGSDPEWNESFLFTITRGCDELHIKLMDENTFQDDDFLGEATISLEEVFREGEVGSTSYQLYKDDEDCDPSDLASLSLVRRGMNVTRITNFCCLAEEFEFMEGSFGYLYYNKI